MMGWEELALVECLPEQSQAVNIQKEEAAIAVLSHLQTLTLASTVNILLTGRLQQFQTCPLWRRLCYSSGPEALSPIHGHGHANKAHSLRTSSTFYNSGRASSPLHIR